MGLILDSSLLIADEREGFDLSAWLHARNLTGDGGVGQQQTIGDSALRDDRAKWEQAGFGDGSLLFEM